jgi:hypothetical protein
LPEYVVIQNGKWAALERSAIRSGTERWFRARVDIVLITDGSIVDLNRIPLPADTPIIDNRFKDRHNKTDAGDGK